MVKNIPVIRPHLLWEFDGSKFDFEKSRTIVIERVVERGDMMDWKEIIRCYGKDNILAIVKNSKNLDIKDKRFTEIYVNSDFNAV